MNDEYIGLSPDQLKDKRIMDGFKRSMNQTKEDNDRLVGGVASIGKHDCWHYTNTNYLIGPEGVARKCCTCGRILEFRYRSFWKRLWRVFVNF